MWQPELVDQGAGIVVVVTRLRVKHLWSLVPAFMKFRHLYGRAVSYPGFIRGHISIVDPWTLMNVSIWRSRWDMLQWSGNDEHVNAVRWTYQQAEEVWSADFQLRHVSKSAYRWDGNLLLSNEADASFETTPPTPSKIE